MNSLNVNSSTAAKRLLLLSAIVLGLAASACHRQACQGVGQNDSAKPAVTVADRA